MWLALRGGTLVKWEMDGDPSVGGLPYFILDHQPDVSSGMYSSAPLPGTTPKDPR